MCDELRKIEQKMKNSPLVLGSVPITKLLMQYAMPAIISTIATSLYNLVDSIFIGQGVGALAIAGLAVTFPLMNLAAAFGSLVGVGASALVSIKFGQKSYDEANYIFGNVILLNLILGISLSIVGLVFIDPLLLFFGASNDTLPFAKDYMRIILIGNVITHLYFGLNAVLRAAGFPRMSMFFTLFSVVVNALLAYTFIFLFDWGIAGAGWSTVLSQLLALIGQLIHFMNKKNIIHFQRGILSLKMKYIKGILSIGVSPFMMNFAACLVVLIINWGMREHGGDLAIGAYGIVNRIVFIFIMINLGFNQGMQPIAGYNYGAKKYDRVMDVTHKAIFCAVTNCTIGTLLCLLFSHEVVGLFTSDPVLAGLSVEGLRIVFCIFPIVGFQMVSSNLFVSIGKSKQAIFLSLTRQVLFLIPFLLILPKYYGVRGVWLSMPLSDVAASITAAILLRRVYKGFKQVKS